MGLTTTTVYNGASKDYESQRNNLKDGDLVVTNGGTYKYNASTGKGEKVSDTTTYTYTGTYGTQPSTTTTTKKSSGNSSYTPTAGSSTTGILNNAINSGNAINQVAQQVATTTKAPYASSVATDTNKTTTPATNTTPTGTKTTVVRADGSTVTGYINNGKTTLADGSSLKEGDKVTSNGKTWVYSESAGKGILESNYVKPSTNSTVSTDTSKYAPTNNAETNSALWRKVASDTELTDAQKKQLQEDLHAKNVELNAGKTFDSSTGKWSDSPTISFDSNKLARDANGNIITGHFDTYEEYENIVNQLKASTTGSVTTGDATFVMYGNKVYYTTDNGNSFYELEANEEVKPSEMNNQQLINYITDMLVDMGATQTELDDFLSWAESQAMAQNQLNPMYDQAMNQALDNINTKALQSGFYGQLPTEALKQNTIATVESERASAIAELALSLRSEDRETAISKLQAQIEAKQLDINSLLEILQIANSYGTKDQIGETTGQATNGQGYSSNGLTTGTNTGTSNTAKATYNNGSLSSVQVKALQNYLGVNTDGYYGTATQSYAGGVDANTAYNNMIKQASASIERQARNGMDKSQLQTNITKLYNNGYIDYETAKELLNKYVNTK